MDWEKSNSPALEALSQHTFDKTPNSPGRQEQAGVVSRSLRKSLEEEQAALKTYGEGETQAGQEENKLDASRAELYKAEQLKSGFFNKKAVEKQKTDAKESFSAQEGRLDAQGENLKNAWERLQAIRTEIDKLESTLLGLIKADKDEADVLEGGKIIERMKSDKDVATADYGVFMEQIDNLTKGAGGPDAERNFKNILSLRTEYYQENFRNLEPADQQKFLEKETELVSKNLQYAKAVIEQHKVRSFGNNQELNFLAERNFIKAIDTVDQDYKKRIVSGEEVSEERNFWLQGVGKRVDESVDVVKAKLYQGKERPVGGSLAYLHQVVDSTLSKIDLDNLSDDSLSALSEIPILLSGEAFYGNTKSEDISTVFRGSNMVGVSKDLSLSMLRGEKADGDFGKIKSAFENLSDTLKAYSEYYLQRRTDFGAEERLDKIKKLQSKVATVIERLNDRANLNKKTKENI